MSSFSLDEQTSALLEPEELAAIREGEEATRAQAEADAAMARAAGPGDDDDDNEGSTTDADDDAAASAPPVEGKGASDADPATPPADPAPAAAAAEPAASEPAAAPSPRVAYVAPLPDDFQERVDTLKAETAALRQKFKDGEIEFDAYTAEQDALQERRDELNGIKQQSETATRMAEQAAFDAREQAANRVFADAKKDGIDYEGNADSYEELKLTMQAVLALPKFAKLDFEAQLREANRRVMLANGIAAGAAPTPSPKPPPAPAPATGKRSMPVDAVPANLSHVPNAHGPSDVGGDEFSDLDKLTGDAFEDALAKLSPAQRARYGESR